MERTVSTLEISAVRQDSALELSPILLEISADRQDSAREISEPFLAAGSKPVREIQSSPWTSYHRKHGD
jgi:hypothetical protein